ncbi:hypothetical protein [Nocardia sp. CNY236]|uniref:hypothetical protein n=1 Tax=Nocardia sp. CNY236 TaxID=1169152 RepID=UPI0004146114|nr:hypothetical protein [Nocardia sp. CNY236]
MSEGYADLEAALGRMRGVPKHDDLLVIWERLDRLDAQLPTIPDQDRRQRLSRVSDHVHHHLRDAWRELGISYETALESYRNWVADRRYPTVLSPLDRPAPKLPDLPTLPDHPVWDGFDR